jgi:chemotaxis protein histidine kinase CheA
MADELIRVDGIVGATDLGDGRVVLILDLTVLSRQTRTYRQRRTQVSLPLPAENPAYEDGAR